MISPPLPQQPPGCMTQTAQQILLPLVWESGSRYCGIFGIEVFDIKVFWLGQMDRGIVVFDLRYLISRYFCKWIESSSANPSKGDWDRVSHRFFWPNVLRALWGLQVSQTYHQKPIWGFFKSSQTIETYCSNPSLGELYPYGVETMYTWDTSGGYAPLCQYVTTFENGGCVAMLMQRFLTIMIDVELRDMYLTDPILPCLSCSP